jgi:hypothetical protein
VLIHHRDIALLRGVRHTTTGNVNRSLFVQPGDSTDLSVQVLEKRPQITVDGNGGWFFMSMGRLVLTVWLVGEIVRETDPSANTSSYDPLRMTQPTSSSTPSEAEHNATNEMALPEPQPPSRPENSQRSVLACAKEVTTTVNLSIEERVSYPSAGKSSEDVDSMKSREDRDATVSALPPTLWYVNNIPLVDPSGYFTSSAPCKSGRFG